MPLWCYAVMVRLHFSFVLQLCPTTHRYSLSASQIVILKTMSQMPRPFKLRSALRTIMGSLSPCSREAVANFTSNALHGNRPPAGIRGAKHTRTADANPSQPNIGHTKHVAVIPRSVSFQEEEDQDDPVVSECKIDHTILTSSANQPTRTFSFQLPHQTPLRKIVRSLTTEVMGVTIIRMGTAVWRRGSGMP